MMPPARWTSPMCNVGNRRRNLAQARHVARDAVDVGHGEIDAGLFGRRQQMQHGIGRAAHRHIEADGIFRRPERRDGARQHRVVVLFVVAAGQFDDLVSGFLNRRSRSAWVANHRAVARQDRPSASVRQFMELARTCRNRSRRSGRRSA